MFSTGAVSWAIGIITHTNGLLESPLIVVLVLMIVATALTQVLSNVGLATTVIPIVVGLAGSMNLPARTFVIPAAVACSLSFMFPMSDPTIAMAYGTGYVCWQGHIQGRNRCNHSFPRNCDVRDYDYSWAFHVRWAISATKCSHYPIFKDKLVMRIDERHADCDHSLLLTAGYFGQVPNMMSCASIYIKSGELADTSGNWGASAFEVRDMRS